MITQRGGIIMRALIIAVFTLFATMASASTWNIINYSEVQESLMDQAEVLGLDWKVGETADYTIKMGFVNGKMHSFVREEVHEGFWVQQDMDMGFLGKQKVEMLIDKNTGEVLQLLVNGEKQAPPEQGDQEVIDMQEANISVPAGTFDCVYLKVRDNKENKESEAWINPTAIPITGMLKTIAPGPMGKVTVELTAFRKM